MAAAESRALETAARAPHGLIVVAAPTGHSTRPVIEAVVGSWLKTSRMVGWMGAPPRSGSPQLLCATPGSDPESALSGLLAAETSCVAIDTLDTPALAALAAQAVSEGRLVLVGVRAADGWTALARLRDLGFSANALGAAVRLVFSTRAVRKLCPACKHSQHLTMERKARALAVDPDALLSDVLSACGCEECRNDGYDGYHTIREVLAVDTEGARVIAQGPDPAAYRQHFSRSKQKTMAQAALQAVLEGATSWEEVEGLIV